MLDSQRVLLAVLVVMCSRAVELVMKLRILATSDPRVWMKDSCWVQALVRLAEMRWTWSPVGNLLVVLVIVPLSDSSSATRVVPRTPIAVVVATELVSNSPVARVRAPSSVVIPVIAAEMVASSRLVAERLDLIP